MPRWWVIRHNLDVPVADGSWPAPPEFVPAKLRSRYNSVDSNTLETASLVVTNALDGEEDPRVDDRHRRVRRGRRLTKLEDARPATRWTDLAAVDGPSVVLPARPHDEEVAAIARDIIEVRETAVVAQLEDRSHRVVTADEARLDV